VNNNGRSEARSVILRLRHYRDRMQAIVAAAGGADAEAGVAGAMLRKIKSLRTDLANDEHECVIGRRRMAQTECEHDFLWPALREAAEAIRDEPAPRATDGRSKAAVRFAQGRIQHYLTQLEGRWPTL